MVAAFGELVVLKGGVDPSVGRVLSSLFDRRGQADYGTSAVPQEGAEAAIADAERFVRAVEAWLEART